MAAGIRLRSVLWLALLGLAATLLVGVTTPTPAAGDTTFIVDNTTDDDTLSACTDAADDCSLRGAVDTANATAGEDTINFAIPEAQCPGGICRITLTGGPLELTEAATVDASTQPQNSAPQANVCATATQPSHMRIELVTTGTEPAGFNITHATGSSTIRGFAIGTDSNGGNRNAIAPQAGSGHHIACNHLGLDAAGDAQLGSISFSNMVLTHATAEAVVVGTNGDGVDDLAERNVFGPGGVAVYINANNNNRISGNYFGFTADGTSSLDTGIVYIRQWSSDNLVGVDYDGVSDEIEANYFGHTSGIYLYPASNTTSGNQVIGNIIGTSPLGTAAPVAIGIEVVDLEAVDTGYEISDNIIVSADQAIRVAGTGSGVAIDGNLIGITADGTARANAVGIHLDESVSVRVSDNLIANSTTAGVRLADTATFGSGSSGNCVVGNTAGVANTTGSAVTFENNWWGATDGPSGVGPGSGDSVSSDVDFDPWLTSPVALCNTAPVASDASFSIAENATIGTAVGTVAATDDGTSLEHSITAGDLGGTFVINAVTGEITTAAALDFEATASYSLTVEVDDGLLTDMATVDIAVANMAPVVSDAAFTVAEDVAVGTTIGTVSADDGAATLEYAITAGDPGGHFAIDAATGQITTAAMLDYETTSLYLLTVEVDDGLLADAATVTVSVTDVVEGPTFTDVLETHTFYLDIEWLAASGITKGCNPPVNDMYCPDQSVTRGQMAAFLHRALDDVLTPGPPVVFTDVAGSVFVTDIEWLGAAGVTKGCNPPANDMFCPGDSVTRGQMAAFLVRAMGYTAGAGSDRFIDDDGLVFEADIERLAEAGVTRGCNPPGNDMFCPNEPVTRGQMAAFLKRALDPAG